MTLSEIKTLAASQTENLRFTVLPVGDAWTVLVRWGTHSHSPLDRRRGEVRIFKTLDAIHNVALQAGVYRLEVTINEETDQGSIW